MKAVITNSRRTVRTIIATGLFLAASYSGSAGVAATAAPSDLTVNAKACNGTSYGCCTETVSAVRRTVQVAAGSTFSSRAVVTCFGSSFMDAGGTLKARIKNASGTVVAVEEKETTYGATTTTVNVNYFCSAGRYVNLVDSFKFSYIAVQPFVGNRLRQGTITTGAGQSFAC